ncbi:MAG: hypothetical protein ABIK65_01490 [Candidatus Eisenbacteria bacterium]
MRKSLLTTICVLLLLAPAGGAFAEMTNTGVDRTHVSGGNVLTDPLLPVVGRILYAPSEADDPALRAAISVAAGGAVVDYFDATAGVPTVSLLSTYDCVYTWANFGYLDNVAFGDNLAAYVDGGGSVVLGAFCTFTLGNFLSGAIMGAGYSPVYSPSGSNWFSSAAYSGDGTTCIHNDVGTYECFYRDDLALQGTGAVDGTYTDGVIAHAYRSDYKVIYSNGSGAVQLGCSGDWALLVANACACEGATSTSSSSWGTVKTMFR